MAEPADRARLPSASDPADDAGRTTGSEPADGARLPSASDPADRWARTTFAVPGMDCPTEEQLVRMALADVPDIADLAFDLGGRQLDVQHRGSSDRVLAAISSLGMGARIESTLTLTGQAADAAASKSAARATIPGERGMLIAVLAINAVMFLVEMAVGLWAQSTGLVADSLDMLADAGVYAIALAAVGGAHVSQRRSARASGFLQLALSGLVIVQVVRHALAGSEPLSAAMVAVGALALAANLACVGLLAAHRRGGLHLRASWIFTTNDALANAGVIVAGLLVAVTGSALPDLLIGTGIALLVASGALRILRMSR